MISEKLENTLNAMDGGLYLLMKTYADEFIKTGKEPEFETMELNSIWFYVKINALSNEISYIGPRQEWAYRRLGKELSLNGGKILNPKKPVLKDGTVGKPKSN